MLWDTHMHSQYSGDSDAPQEDMIRAAIRAKLPGICFTDHLEPVTWTDQQRIIWTSTIRTTRKRSC